MNLLPSPLCMLPSSFYVASSLAASEALFGAALMAVFVVCLSKKYVR